MINDENLIFIIEHVKMDTMNVNVYQSFKDSRTDQFVFDPIDEFHASSVYKFEYCVFGSSMTRELLYSINI